MYVSMREELDRFWIKKKYIYIFNINIKAILLLLFTYVSLPDDTCFCKFSSLKNV